MNIIKWAPALGEQYYEEITIFELISRIIVDRNIFLPPIYYHDVFVAANMQICKCVNESNQQTEL